MSTAVPRLCSRISSIVRRALLLLGIALATALSGCAAGYRAYPDACIPYAYCRPAPLPYATYAPHGCPTPVAARYRQQTASQAAPETDYVPATAPAAPESVEPE